MPHTVTTPDGQSYNFPDSMSAPQIQMAMQRITAQQNDQPYDPNVAAASMPGSPQQLGGQLQQKIFGLLPSGGGMIGGIGGMAAGTLVGGPIGGVVGGLLGAFSGGAGGEAGRERLAGEPLDPHAILKEGGMQGLYQGAGELTMGAAQLGGRYLVKKGAPVAASWLRRAPEVYNTIFGNKLAPGRGVFGRVGSAAARDVELGTLGIREAALDAATTAGTTASKGDLADGLINNFIELRRRPPNAVEEAGLIEKARLISNWALDEAGGNVAAPSVAQTWTPNDVQAIKDITGRKVPWNGKPPATMRIADLKAINRTASDWLNRKVPVTSMVGDNIDDVNRQLQGAMYAKRTMEHAEALDRGGRPAVKLRTIIGGHHGPLDMGAFLPDLGMSHWAAARAGFAALHPTTQTALMNAPRALAAFVHWHQAQQPNGAGR